MINRSCLTQSNTDCTSKSKKNRRGLLVFKELGIRGFTTTFLGLALAGTFGCSSPTSRVAAGQKENPIMAKAKIAKLPELFRAAAEGQVEIIKDLIETKGEDPNHIESEDDLTPVMVAAFYNKPDAIQALADDGADLDATDRQGMTALHWAVLSKAKEALAVLLENVANPNYQTLLSQDTPLTLAIKQQSLDLVVSLIENGSSLNLNDVSGNSPLHIAVAKNNVAIARAIIYVSPKDESMIPLVIGDIEAKDNTGRTPLLLAVENKNVEMVQLLLEAAADPDNPNQSGLSPAKLVQSGRPEFSAMAPLFKGMEAKSEK